MVFSMSVTLFWMFSKVPKWRPLRTFFIVYKGKSQRGCGQMNMGTREPQESLSRSKLVWQRGQCDMVRCYYGSSFCLQCLSHANGPFSEPFKDIFIKKKHLKDVTDMLKTTPVEDLQRCYQKWEQRLHLCVAIQENYFEGHKTDVWKK